MNNLICLLPAFLVAKFARNLNNPTSSKKIDSIVIEMNSIKIFKGLTVEELVKVSIIVLMLTCLNKIRIVAQTKDTSQ